MNTNDLYCPALNFQISVQSYTSHVSLLIACDACITVEVSLINRQELYSLAYKWLSAYWNIAQCCWYLRYISTVAYTSHPSDVFDDEIERNHLHAFAYPSATCHYNFLFMFLHAFPVFKNNRQVYCCNFKYNNKLFILFVRHFIYRNVYLTRSGLPTSKPL